MGNALNLFPTSQAYGINEIIFNALVATVLGLGLAWIYKRTHKGVSYSQSYVMSLVIVTITTAIAIMVIGQSLTRAFGLIGAFSVVRFRTAIKDMRDIAFLFFALVEGLAAGTGSFSVGAVGFIIFSLIVVVLTKIQFGKYSGFEYLLSFRDQTKTGHKAPYLKLFDQYLSDYLLISFRSTALPTEVLASYSVRLKDTHKAKEFLSELKKTGAKNIELISSQSDIDY